MAEVCWVLATNVSLFSSERLAFIHMRRSISYKFSITSYFLMMRYSSTKGLRASFCFILIIKEKYYFVPATQCCATPQKAVGSTGVT